MGNREALLDAARQCISEKGIAGTSARDLAQTAGVSLAAIGYHFGGKDELLAEALLDLVGEGVGGTLLAALARRPEAGFRRVWTEVLAGFADQRTAMVASLESLAHAQHAPDVARRFADGQREALAEIAAALRAHADLDDKAATEVAGLYYALLNGLAVMWITDPSSTPDAASLRGAAVAVAAD